MKGRFKRNQFAITYIGQSEWRHYAETEYIRSMGQAAVMADGSILLLGGQVTFLNSTDFFFSTIKCSVPYPRDPSPYPSHPICCGFVFLFTRKG